MGYQNKVKLIRVPENQGIECNERTHKIAKEGSEKLPKPDINLALPKSKFRGFITDWVQKKHNNTWESVPKPTHGKTFLRRPWSKRT